MSYTMKKNLVITTAAVPLQDEKMRWVFPVRPKTVFTERAHPYRVRR